MLIWFCCLSAMIQLWLERGGPPNLKFDYQRKYDIIALLNLCNKTVIDWYTEFWKCDQMRNIQSFPDQKGFLEYYIALH